MSKHIQIHVDAFTSHINKLERAILNVDERMLKDEAFECTNIKPYVNDLENTKKLIQILQEYKKLFQADIETLNTISVSFKEKDEQLAKSYEKDVQHEVQPLS